MISILDPKRFEPFGRPVRSFDAVASERLSAGVEPPEMLSVCEDGEVLLDVQEGLPVLLVADRDGERLVAFLLDRPVVVGAGVPFAVVALDGTCRYRRAVRGDGPLTESPRSRPLPLLTLAPTLDIARICTLFYQDREPAFHFRGERHPFWELTYVDKGRLVSTAAGEERTLEQGAVVLYAPDVLHAQRGDGKNPAGFITATFEARMDAFLPWSGRAIPADDALREAVAAMLREGSRTEAYAEDLAVAHLKIALVRLFRMCQGKEDDASTPGRAHRRPDTALQASLENAIVQRCTAFIDRHLADPIDLEAVAGSIPVSRSYLAFLFQKHKGMTVNVYKREQRLEHGRALIRQGGMTLAEVARAIGYRSPAYFSNEFHRRFGISPSEYARTVEGATGLDPG
jgi:AraC-like DNA-binding protein